MHLPGNTMRMVFGTRAMSNDSYEEFTKRGRKGRKTRKRKNGRWHV